MPTVDKHPPGFFCWIELATTDTARAKAFYNGLFGWQPKDIPMGPDSFYTLLQIDGKDVAALHAMDDDQRKQGIPPHWLEYVAVASADDTAARARSLGGTVLAEPFDVFDVGRMAVLQDPTGAVIAIWQAKTHIGARIVGELHTLAWSDLSTRNKPKAQEFYVKLFGWQARNQEAGPHQYTEIHHQGKGIGGMMEIDPAWGNVPPHWMPYFPVAHCDTSVAKAQSLGASVTVPPRDIEHVGRFSVLRDPQGAVFAVIQLTGQL
jgi:predicted enzyme related to lactoylglutathione lyase